MTRRDRFGEPLVDADLDAEPLADLDDLHREDDATQHQRPEDDEHESTRGWLDVDAAVPCPRCRPWLVERRPPRPEELDALRRGP